MLVAAAPTSTFYGRGLTSSHRLTKACRKQTSWRGDQALAYPHPFVAVGNIRFAALMAFARCARAGLPSSGWASRWLPMLALFPNPLRSPLPS